MSGVHFETNRFYENEGVLPETKRAHNGYRLYDQKYVLMLSFITEARKLDFSLKEILILLFEKQKLNSYLNKK
ncbi:MerR family transcriptional regulator [Bacillus sp. NPDC093026]|uniref:MerR family transcriptional regulator n=1 Tax=Bacillus sp. NPDC093026 TaxID=3363948 RepID=UPI0037FE956F